VKFNYNNSCEALLWHVHLDVGELEIERFFIQEVVGVLDQVTSDLMLPQLVLFDEVIDWPLGLLLALLD